MNTHTHTHIYRQWHTDTHTHMTNAHMWTEMHAIFPFLRMSIKPHALSDVKSYDRVTQNIRDGGPANCEIWPYFPVHPGLRLSNSATEARLTNSFSSQLKREFIVTSAPPSSLIPFPYRKTIPAHYTHCFSLPFAMPWNLIWPIFKSLSHFNKYFESLSPFITERLGPCACVSSFVYVLIRREQH